MAATGGGGAAAGGAGDGGDAGFDAVCAMDFGTHGSEVAIGFPKTGAFDLFAAAKEVVNLGGGETKQASAVLLDPTDLKLLAFGDTAKREFASACDTAGSALFAHQFKMVLQPPKDGAARPTPIDKIPVEADHSSGEKVTLDVVILLARILQALKERAFEWLVERGQRPDTMRIKYVITVPAIWDEPGKRVMRLAAFHAGLIEKEDSKALLLALEPECAALATIADLTDGSAVSKVGASVLIVDAGGGTVDIVMDEVTGTKPWQLAEVREADGGPWGATYVDKEFEEFLKELLGGDRYGCIDHSTKIKLMQSWEAEKKAFAQGKSAGITLKLVEFIDSVQATDDSYKSTDVARSVTDWNNRKHTEGALASPEEGCTWTGNKKTLFVPGRIAEGFFQATTMQTANKVTDILQELANQRKPMPTRVCLVGGYANCKLLKDRVESSAAAFGVDVILPKKPSSAVVTGAVLFGLQPRVITERVVRYTYAYIGAERFNPEVHDEKNTIVGADGIKRCLVLFPLVHQGDKVKVGHKSIKDNLIPISETQETVDFELFSIKSTDPVANPTDTSQSKLPRSVVAEEGKDTGKNPRVLKSQKAGELKVVIGGVGRPRGERKVSLEMSFGETEVTATAKSAITGESREVMLKY